MNLLSQGQLGSLGITKLVPDSYNRVYEKHAHMAISESNIAHNVAAIRARTAARLIAVIKENGYGIGLWNAYSILRFQGVDFFAVQYYEEAMRLRSFGWEGDILLMSPQFDPKRLATLIDSGVILMLGSYAQGQAIRSASAVLNDKQPRVHIKIDTGLGRYGFRKENWSWIPKSVHGLKVEGCYTHFASGKHGMLRQIEKQMRVFIEAVDAMRAMDINPGVLHAASSKSFMLKGDLGLDAVRIGSLLLGRSAMGTSGAFKNAVTLKAEICNIYKGEQRECAGYAGTLRLKGRTVGIVMAGSIDGVQLRQQLLGQSFFRDFIRLFAYHLRGKRQSDALIGHMGLGHIVTSIQDGQHVGDMVEIPINPLLAHPNLERIVNWQRAL